MRIFILILFLPFISNSQIIRGNGYYTSMTAAAGCTPDADAQKFIDSAGITNQTQKDAICTLVHDLKDSSLWTLMYAIYPMVGGTASTNKWNLKDPRNLDAAYRIDFQGTWTHSSSGADPTDGYGNTFVNGSTTLAEYDRHWSLYCTQNTSNQGWSGVYNGSNAFGFNNYYITNSYGTGLNNLINTGTNATTLNDGYFIGSVNNSGASGGTYYRNGSSVASVTTNSMNSNFNFYIGALNNSGTAVFFNDRNLAFVSLGTKLNNTEAAVLNTIVEAFNDALGRGVQ